MKMMKHLKKTASILAATIVAPFILSSSVLPDPKTVNSNGISPISGTFIQPWLYNSFSDDRWDKEIEKWKEMGIEYLIIGDTAWVYTDEGYSIKTDYPSKIEGVSSSTDALTKVFEKCKDHDIKIFLGVGNTVSNTGVGWGFLDFTKKENVDTIKKLGEVFGSIAEDLYNVYYEDYKDIFAGYYFVPELYNSNHFDNPTSRANYVNGLAEGMNIMFDKISSLDGDLPLALSPYVNIFGGGWVTKNPESHSAFWKELLATAHFRDGDILVPQDSVGAGGMDLENLAVWTKAYKDAVDGCGKDVKLWSNCEIFVQPKETENLWPTDGVNYWSSAPIDRMVKQFEIVADYVDRIVTFAEPHYLSPYNAVPGYYNTYMDYLKTGELEKNPPTPPDKFKTIVSTVEGKQVLSVYWSGMYDDYGIHRVNIYKNGELFTYRVSNRVESGQSNLYPGNFYDDEFDLENDTATYEFEVIDCAGNISEKSSFTVEKGSVPNNVKLDRPYNGPVEKEESATSEVSYDLNTSDNVSNEPSNNNNAGLILGLLGAATAVVSGIVIYNILRRKKK